MMEQTGFVRMFGQYTTEMLGKMREDLGLSMPVEALRFCAGYYRKELKRDPAIEELRLLDGMFVRASSSVAAVSIDELLTNDDFVARTYADMMNKRSACAQNPTSPVVLEELPRLINRYLERCGKRVDVGSYATVMEDLLAAPLSGAGDTRILPKGSRFCLRAIKRCTLPPSAGDWLILLRPSMDQSDESYRFSLGRLLEDPALEGHLHAVSPVGNMGLLKTILSLTNGVTLDLAFLSRKVETLSLSNLNNGFEGELLVRIPKESSKLWRSRAEAMGLQIAVFGAITNEEAVQIFSARKKLYEWKTSFLRSLVHLEPIKAHLANEENTLCKISLSCEDPLQNAYIAKTSAPKEELCRVVGERLFSASLTAPEDRFFFHGLYAALLSVSVLAASGCSYQSADLSFSILCPLKGPHKEAYGETVSALLGLYRAQAELAIPTRSVSFAEDADLLHPVLSVFASANGTSIPSRLVGEGNGIYLLRPVIGEQGIPDFGALRKLLAELTEWRKNGVSASARVLCGETVAQAINEMETEAFCASVECDPALLEEACPFGILVEVSEELPYTLIGRVKGKEPETAENDSPLNRLPGELPLWGAAPEIVLLSKPCDADAYALASRLTDKGADVKIFTEGSKEADLLPRAILSARALLLCGEVTLPKDARMHLALETLRRAGGLCISLGSKNQDADLTLLEGFLEEELDQLCAIL